MRSRNWGESYAELKQTGNGPSKSDFNTLSQKVDELTRKVHSLMLMNQRLLAIINNPDWEEVREGIEKEE
jgi:hypothetical protein